MFPYLLSLSIEESLELQYNRDGEINFTTNEEYSIDVLNDSVIVFHNPQAVSGLMKKGDTEIYNFDANIAALHFEFTVDEGLKLILNKKSDSILYYTAFKHNIYQSQSISCKTTAYIIGTNFDYKIREKDHEDNDYNYSFSTNDKHCMWILSPHISCYTLTSHFLENGFDFANVYMMSNESSPLILNGTVTSSKTLYTYGKSILAYFQTDNSSPQSKESPYLFINSKANVIADSNQKFANGELEFQSKIENCFSVAPIPSSVKIENQASECKYGFENNSVSDNNDDVFQKVITCIIVALIVIIIFIVIMAVIIKRRNTIGAFDDHQLEEMEEDEEESHNEEKNH